MNEMRKARAKPLFEVVPYRVARLNAAMVRLLAHSCETNGISFQQWRVLSLIGSFGTVGASDIVEWTTNDKALVSRVLSQMETAGLIERRVNLEDGRKLAVAPTQRGWELYAKIGALLDANEETLLDGMGADEVATLVATLKRLEDRTQEQLAAALGVENGRRPKAARKAAPARVADARERDTSNE